MRRILIGLVLALAVLPAGAQTINKNTMKCEDHNYFGPITAAERDACTALIQSGGGLETIEQELITCSA